MANLVKPIVRLFFPCEDAVVDLGDQKWTLKDPLHTIQMPPGVTANFFQQDIWLYAQFTDGVGAFNLSVQLRDYESGLVVGTSPPSPRQFPGGGQLDVVEEVFHLTHVPFARAGLYEFKLLANHAELDGGTAYLRVLPG